MAVAFFSLCASCIPLDIHIPILKVSITVLKEVSALYRLNSPSLCQWRCLACIHILIVSITVSIEVSSSTWRIRPDKIHPLCHQLCPVEENRFAALIFSYLPLRRQPLRASWTRPARHCSRTVQRGTCRRRHPSRWTSLGLRSCESERCRPLVGGEKSVPRGIGAGSSSDRDPRWWSWSLGRGRCSRRRCCRSTMGRRV